MRSDLKKLFADAVNEILNRFFSVVLQVADEQEGQRVNTERVRKVVHLVQGRALEAALKTADVGSARDEAKVFLGQTLRITCFSQACSKVVSVGFGALHP